MASAQTYLLSNSELAVSISPNEGGRVASFRSFRSGLEFLTQSNYEPAHGEPSLSAIFQDGPCAGIEECLPTVGTCGIEPHGGPVPDHGDFWQLAWTVTTYSHTHLELQAIGFSRPLLFSKKLYLEGSTLRVRYRIENIGKEPMSFLYACHPLFAVSAGDRIVLPEEVVSLSLNYSRQHRLGVPGSTILWPRPQPLIELDVVETSDSGFAEMLYTGPLEAGGCGIYRSQEQQGLRVSFDTNILPYLGVWLCYGGWPDNSEKPFQYAVALEPTFAPCNNLTEAQRAQLAKVLAPRENITWDISFQLTDPGVFFEEFRHWCAGPPKLLTP